MPPPLLGQHTDEILRDRLGLNAQDIDTLRKKAAI
jgi:crotonobetainyl-CoA:carnitine CoA-transferase CaiB-like acyl-CoA transferase